MQRSLHQVVIVFVTDRDLADHYKERVIHDFTEYWAWLPKEKEWSVRELKDRIADFKLTVAYVLHTWLFTLKEKMLKIREQFEGEEEKHRLKELKKQHVQVKLA